MILYRIGQVLRWSKWCISLSSTIKNLTREFCMVPCTLPFFSEMFASREDQCLTAVTQELWLQYVRIFCWFPARLWDLSYKSLEQFAVSWVYSVQGATGWLP